MVTVITEKLKYQNLAEEESIGQTLVSTSSPKKRRQSLQHCKENRNLESGQSEMAIYKTGKDHTAGMCLTTPVDQEPTTSPTTGASDSPPPVVCSDVAGLTAATFLLGPPCIAEVTSLRSSQSYDNLPRPVAVRVSQITSSTAVPLTASQTVSLENTATSFSDPGPCGVDCGGPDLDPSVHITGTGNSAFKPIRAGDHTSTALWESVTSSGQVYLLAASPHDRLCNGHSATPVVPSPMDWSRTVLVDQQQTQQTPRPQPSRACTTSNPSPIKRCQSQPCLCWRSPTSMPPRKSRLRHCRHSQCSVHRRRHSPADLLVLSSGRSFLVGLPQFYRSSAGRRSRILADLALALSSGTMTSNGVSLLPKLTRPQSCLPVCRPASVSVSVSGHQHICSPVDYPELDINQIEND